MEMMSDRICQSVARVPLYPKMTLGHLPGLPTFLIADSIVQRLVISFGLQIKPSYGQRSVDCRIRLDQLFITASRMGSTQDSGIESVVPDHYFVVEEA